jgi:uncharacterized protein YegJ (DUF2314 family)
MKVRNLLFCASLIFTCWSVGFAQQSGKASQPPEDKPVSVQAEQLRKFEEAIKPHVEQAKKTYPEAKKRFLAGLPPKEKFYVTVKLRDESGRFEQSFIAVEEIKDGTITGTIANEITHITKYKFGDEYTFPESELLDWTITKADGTEEGNFVGKFLDTYQP